MSMVLKKSVSTLQKRNYAGTFSAIEPIMEDFISALSLIYYADTWYGYHPVQPPLSGHLLSGHPPLSGQ